MPLSLAFSASQVFSTVPNVLASQAFIRFYTFPLMCGYFQKILSQQKRKATHPSIKQYFCSKPKHKFLAASQPEIANTSSSDCKDSFDSDVQKEQHSTVGISIASLVLANSQSAGSNT